jgi:hypothetical protein
MMTTMADTSVNIDMDVKDCERTFLHEFSSHHENHETW